MRLGSPIFGDVWPPDEWALKLRKAGCRAAFCPVDEKADDATLRAYIDAAKLADIVIAEVGVWNNPLNPDDTERRKAIEQCRAKLALAERIGARCCVNIAGSRSTSNWFGPDIADLNEDTFDMIVRTTRSIIDAVRPTRTFYCLETMQWLFPDSAESYLRLLKAIDRKHFAVHLDPVNLITSPRLYFNNARLIRHCFAMLGGHLKSCHAKDVILEEKLGMHLTEVRPGQGYLDYGVYLEELSKLPADTPLMLEHLEGPGEYAAAMSYIRSVAGARGLRL
jgi:sugar phosphate isomerase/epimerase